jgi:hypothetical protein
MVVFVRCQKILTVTVHCGQVQQILQSVISNSICQVTVFMNGSLLFF